MFGCAGPGPAAAPPDAPTAIEKNSNHGSTNARLSTGNSVIAEKIESPSDVSIRGQRIKLVRPKSWVRITVEGADPDEVALFQIPNPADEGTSDSANALVTVGRWPNVKIGGDARLADIMSRPGSVIVSDLTGDDGRRVILARMQLGRTPYLEISLLRSMGNLSVWCSTTYPLLEKTTAEWNDAILRDFKAFASSVSADGATVFPGSDPTATGQKD
jgi:hypothetical protein